MVAGNLKNTLWSVSRNFQNSSYNLPIMYSCNDRTINANSVLMNSIR